MLNFIGSSINTGMQLLAQAAQRITAGQEQVPVQGEATSDQAHETAPVRTEAGQDTTGADGAAKDSVELSREAEEIRKLQMRDREVRAHEAAHAATGGQYAGSPSYSYEKGLDGKTYATGGEVGIDISPVNGDPEATLQKAMQIRAAALAPAQPSSQDLKVAQKAQMMASEARQKLASKSSDNLETDSISEDSPEGHNVSVTDESFDTSVSLAVQPALAAGPSPSYSIDIYS